MKNQKLTLNSNKWGVNNTLSLYLSFSGFFIKEM
jgi:hypothetical protein